MWFDERTANAICTACFHSSSRYESFFFFFAICYSMSNVERSSSVYLCLRIMIASLSFLLDYEKIEDDDDSDASSSEDESRTQAQHAVISKEAVYKVFLHHITS